MNPRIKARIVPIDAVRSKGNIGMWFCPAAWNGTPPADALSQALTALKAGAVLATAIITGAVRELTASEVRGFAAPVFTDTPWDQSTDKLVMDLTTENGNLSPLEIMCAPQEGILDGGHRDLNVAQVATLIQELTTGGVCNRAGQLFLKCVGGYRNSTGATDTKPGGV